MHEQDERTAPAEHVTLRESRVGDPLVCRQTPSESQEAQAGEAGQEKESLRTEELFPIPCALIGVDAVEKIVADVFNADFNDTYSTPGRHWIAREAYYNSLCGCGHTLGNHSPITGECMLCDHKL